VSRGVDPDVEGGPPRPSQRGCDSGTGRRLFGDRDRIFEIEDHGGGAERQRFFDAPRMVAGCEQKAAQQWDGGPPWQAAQLAPPAAGNQPGRRHSQRGIAASFRLEA
jgi:hypothetical protein